MAITSGDEGLFVKTISETMGWLHMLPPKHVYHWPELGFPHMKLLRTAFTRMQGSFPWGDSPRLVKPPANAIQVTDSLRTVVHVLSVLDPRRITGCYVNYASLYPPGRYAPHDVIRAALNESFCANIPAHSDNLDAALSGAFMNGRFVVFAADGLSDALPDAVWHELRALSASRCAFLMVGGSGRKFASML